MKRTIALWLAIVICFSTMAPLSSMADVQLPLRVVLDGRELVFPDAQPYADENNRTQVPARFIAEALGAEVTWHQEEEKASFVLDDQTLVFYFGKKQYELNGKKRTMDTVALVQDHRTFVPVRYVAESFGAAVEWDPAVWTVYIRSGALPKPDPDEGNVQYYDGIAFDDEADADEWGVMSVAKSTEFTRKMADTMQFTKEDGKFVIKGSFPELPEEYKWTVVIRVYDTNGKRISIRNDEIAREGYTLPREGSFTYIAKDISNAKNIDFTATFIAIEMKETSHFPRWSMSSEAGDMLINTRSKSIGFVTINNDVELFDDFDFDYYYQWE